MEYSVKSGNPEKQRNACVIVGVFERRKLSESAQAFDELTEGSLGAITRRGDMNGKLGQTLTLFNLPNTLCDRVILVGLGKERDLDEARYRRALTASYKALRTTGARDAISYLTVEKVKNTDYNWRVRQALYAFEAAYYQIDDLKSNKSEEQKLNHMIFTVPSRRNLPDAESALEESVATLAGIQLAKDLANLPGNVCTPSYLAEQAQQLDRDYSKLKTTIHEEAELEKMGMGSFLSVARGSRQPPKLIVMEYMGGKKGEAPTVLVGKGLTFDAGGISIKPAGGMDEMKFDMCGGASVFGALKAAAEMKLKLNVVGIVPSSENLPDGAANKPGDVVKSMSGKTIEILNTDAEGRLILCDALTFAERYEPESVVDIATLTGACVIALGHHASGMFTDDRGLARELRNAGNAAHDRVWELPLWDDYQSQLKSSVADMANIGGREAGSVTAACFLSRFTKKYRWAHLDIAGSAWRSGRGALATGRPVPLLTEYLIAKSRAA